MHPALENIDWERFLGRSPLPSASTDVLSALRGESILITGAGGSIGSALAARCVALGARRLIALDASENRLFHLQERFAGMKLVAQPTILLGNAADARLMDEIFSIHAPKLVFHAAAYKHVPLLEEQSLAAMANNVLATATLTEVAAAHHARTVLLSTDKAVMPVSILGATKRFAEQIVLERGGMAVRLGNVLGSSDSVAEIFAHQIEQGGPITVTDPAARRFFLTLDEAAELLLAASSGQEENSILTPSIEKPHFISDLARFLASEIAPCRPVSIAFTRLRPGDKEAESLWSPDESATPSSIPGLLRVKSPRIAQSLLESTLETMRHAVAERDRTTALNCLRALVPGFMPGEMTHAAAQSDSLRAVR